MQFQREQFLHTAGKIKLYFCANIKILTSTLWHVLSVITNSLRGFTELWLGVKFQGWCSGAYLVFYITVSQKHLLSTLMNYFRLCDQTKPPVYPNFYFPSKVHMLEESDQQEKLDFVSSVHSQAESQLLLPTGRIWLKFIHSFILMKSH